jgi:hypothetical protein
MTRKTHVPAYWPVVAGVQALEYRGVVMEVKKVIIGKAMDAMAAASVACMLLAGGG